METSRTLSDIRKGSGISQEKLAEELGVSRQTVGRWEQGISSPSMENLVKLSQVFGVPVDALVKDGWAPSEKAGPGIQFVEVPAAVPVPVEAPTPRPGNYRLLALLAALILIAGVLVGALFFRERQKESVLSTELESEVIEDSAIGEPVELLPPWES